MEARKQWMNDWYTLNDEGKKENLSARVSVKHDQGNQDTSTFKQSKINKQTQTHTHTKKKKNLTDFITIKTTMLERLKG